VKKLLLSLIALRYYSLAMMPELVYSCNSSMVPAVGVNKAVGCQQVAVRCQPGAVGYDPEAVGCQPGAQKCWPEAALCLPLCFPPYLSRTGLKVRLVLVYSVGLVCFDNRLKDRMMP